MIKQFTNNFNFFLLLVLFLFICGPLFTLSLFGPGDDLNYVKKFESSSFFFKELNNFFLDKPIFFQRPISAFFIALSHFVFGDNFKLYMYAFFFLFLTTNFFIYKSVKLIIGKTIANTFLILSITPFLTSALLQSPYLFSELILPILFWSISFLYLVLSLKNEKNFFFISHFFLLLSLLCTVISFPLFTINLLLPLLFWSKNFCFKKFFFKIAFPIFCIFLIYFCYLLFVKFFFKSHIYGLSSLNSYSLYQAIYYYFTIFVEFPIMLLEGLKFASFSDFFIIFILVVFFFFKKRKRKLKKLY